MFESPRDLEKPADVETTTAQHKIERIDESRETIVLKLVISRLMVALSDYVSCCNKYVVWLALHCGGGRLF